MNDKAQDVMTNCGCEIHTESSMSMQSVRFFSMRLYSSFSPLYVALHSLHSAEWFPWKKIKSHKKVETVLGIYKRHLYTPLSLPSDIRWVLVCTS